MELTKVSGKMWLWHIVIKCGNILKIYKHLCKIGWFLRINNFLGAFYGRPLVLTKVILKVLSQVRAKFSSSNESAAFLHEGFTFISTVLLDNWVDINLRIHAINEHENQYRGFPPLFSMKVACFGESLS